MERKTNVGNVADCRGGRGGIRTHCLRLCLTLRSLMRLSDHVFRVASRRITAGRPIQLLPGRKRLKKARGD